MYAAIEFVGEDCSEVVLSQWIETTSGKQYCYYPRANGKRKVARGELADKDKWSCYAIRVFKYTDDFEEADKLAEKYQFTSNVESDTEDRHSSPLPDLPTRQPTRQRNKPSRYINSDSEHGADDEDDDHPTTAIDLNKKRRRESSQDESDATLPIAPVVTGKPLVTSPHHTRRPTARLATSQQPMAEIPRTPSQHRCTETPLSTARTPSSRTPSLHRPETPLSTCRTPSQHANLTTPTSATNDAPLSTSPSQHRRPETPLSSSRTPSRHHSETPPTLSTSRTPSRHTNLATPKSATENDLDMKILVRLDTIISNQQTGLNLIRGIASHLGMADNEEIADIIPQPATTKEELDELCQQLSEKDVRKKMVLLLSSVAGTGKESMRRILDKVATAALWSSYNFGGHRGKDGIKELPITKVIISAYARANKGASYGESEKRLKEALKHTPSRPGGSLYVKRRVNRELEELNVGNLGI